MFDKRFLRIFKNGTLVVKGLRNWTDGLWDVTIAAQQQKMNMIIRKDKTKMELAEYLHKCAFSPSLSTFQRAIRKGHLINWPGIADINFEKYITNLTLTAKGHLDQERANLQSTRDKNKNTLNVDFEPNDGNSTKPLTIQQYFTDLIQKKKRTQIKQVDFLIAHHEAMNIS